MTDPLQPGSGESSNDPAQDATQVVEHATAPEAPPVLQYPMPARPDQLAQPVAPEQPEAAVQPSAAPYPPPGPAVTPHTDAPQYAAPQYPAPGQPAYPVPPGAQAPGQYVPYAPPAYGQTGPLPAYGQTGPLPVQTGPAPYGQPPYGQPPQPGQPGEAKSGPSTALKAIIGSLITVLVVGGLLAFTAFIAPGWAPKTLSQSGAEDGVKQILTKNYLVEKLSNVSCPSGERVKEGNSFDCTVTIEGRQQKVTLTFIDNKGGFEVGPPH